MRLYVFILSLTFQINVHAAGGGTSEMTPEHTILYSGHTSARLEFSENLRSKLFDADGVALGYLGPRGDEHIGYLKPHGKGIETNPVCLFEQHKNYTQFELDLFKKEVLPGDSHIAQIAGGFVFNRVCKPYFHVTRFEIFESDDDDMHLKTFLKLFMELIRESYIKDHIKHILIQVFSNQIGLMAQHGFKTIKDEEDYCWMLCNLWEGE